ncbi:uncharacterized protein LOC143303473 isoform X2 [Bombus vancouverensis nearcticus]|uniref:uncharacterized protein LOC143303473 isoform X2 n=1 Tax=Bombus vancouverensis nearcticus TaxID=2705178 RepID=UPI00402B5006
MEVRAMEYRPVMPTGVIPTGLQDYHTTIPDLSPPRSQGSSTGGASSIGDYAPRMYTPPTPPTPHDDDKNHLTLIKSVKILPFTKKRFREIHR